MVTAVFFHAHPDDESIATAGTMAQMAAAGHRVVLITATRGELGEVPDGYLDPGETLAERRALELDAACAVLGVARHEYLGYGDSGMEGEDSNNDPGSFWQADVEEAAERLAAVLRAEGAEVLTAYDERGNYGHPDHIQVHRVGLRAAELAGVPRVFMATVNRDHLLRLDGVGRRRRLCSPPRMSVPPSTTWVWPRNGSPPPST
jgi:LmbE family N-acetylglucosaminyl deacetylase